MIEQQAVVKEVQGEQVRLISLKQSACSSCAIQATCGTQVYSHFLPNREVVIHSPIKVNAGDTVLVAIDEKHLAIASVVVYLLPLLLMLAIVGGYGGSNVVAVLLSVTGLGIGLWLVNRYQYYVTQYIAAPTIVRQC